MSIPVMAHAQTSAAERSLMNQVRLEPRSQVGEHQQASRGGRSDQSQASRALLGTVGASPFAGSEMEATGSGFPTPEQLLLGQPVRPKRIEN
jgi:hypothetical protein